MAESFVKTMKRDYVSWMPSPDAKTALHDLAIAFDHYAGTTSIDSDPICSTSGGMCHRSIRYGS